MTQTMVSCDQRHYTAAAIVEMHQITLTRRIEQMAAAIAGRPVVEHIAWLGILLAELRRAGVDVELLECALDAQ